MPVVELHAYAIKIAASNYHEMKMFCATRGVEKARSRTNLQLYLYVRHGVLLRLNETSYDDLVVLFKSV